jgi:hypothetical protein
MKAFDEYLKRCDRAVCECLGRHPSAGVVSESLGKLASYLWENHAHHIPLSVMR